MAIVKNTLGSLIDGGDIMRAVCRPISCGRVVDLDIEALARKLGRDHSCMSKDIAPKLHCTACGGKNCGIQIVPGNTPSGRYHTLRS